MSSSNVPRTGQCVLHAHSRPRISRVLRRPRNAALARRLPPYTGVNQLPAKGAEHDSRKEVIVMFFRFAAVVAIVAMSSVPAFADPSVSET